MILRVQKWRRMSHILFCSLGHVRIISLRDCPELVLLLASKAELRYTAIIFEYAMMRLIIVKEVGHLGYLVWSCGSSHLKWRSIWCHCLQMKQVFKDWQFFRSCEPRQERQFCCFLVIRVAFLRCKFFKFGTRIYFMSSLGPTWLELSMSDVQRVNWQKGGILGFVSVNCMVRWPLKWGDWLIFGIVLLRWRSASSIWLHSTFTNLVMYFIKIS